MGGAVQIEDQFSVGLDVSAAGLSDEAGLLPPLLAPEATAAAAVAEPDEWRV